MPAILQKVVTIQSDNSCLIGLCNIRKYDINHAYKHAVFQWVSCILNNGDNVGTCLGNIDEVTSRTVREFNCVNHSSWSNNVRNVRTRSSSCCSDIKNLGTRFDPDIINSSEYCCSDLGSERIPNTVFNLGSASIRTRRSLNTDSLFAVYSNTRGAIQGYQSILLSTSNKDTLVTMGFNDNLHSSLHSPSSSATASSSSSSITSTASSSSSTAASTATSTSSAAIKSSSSAAASTSSSATSASIKSSSSASASACHSTSSSW
mmetsp:Transcript_9422/g.14216  ORF Transcript_9422/g.14216 Transcript_9422/m.14216 type:complete len:262 (-) Transcript_9422:101-886(-)